MIKTKDIFFSINENQYIKIIMSCPDQVFFHRFDPIKIIFYNEKKRYILSNNDFLGPELEPLQWFFKAATERQLELPETINEDLGYLYNEEIHFSITNSEKKIDRKIHSFLLCDGNRYTTWLYIKNNSIFLQITPMYKWHYSDPEKKEKFVSYDKFIKKYKSCLTVEIKRETMAEWVTQSDEIIKSIRDE